ncbi:NepR family anti-sigma factor [Qipengyuania sediminis]|uniref:NepR family anti-sigma factor n=1 Tax=Qipengyuania sediminis TaxID=1532023 RepID=UPI0010597419|nr:NepR family anti-sigma factor [Qipengyuania sediminis]
MTHIDKGSAAGAGRTQTEGPGRARAAAGRAQAKGEMPGWTNGLRQLYDQVVDEDLPDSFRDLLARLDQGK